jgi:hypothetical protein
MRLRIALAFAIGLLLVALPAHAAQQSEKRAVKRERKKWGLGEVHYQTEGRQGRVHVLKVWRHGSKSQYPDGTLTVKEVRPGKARVVEFTTADQN